MKLKTYGGKCGIKVTVLAYSITQAGIPFITYEIEYPRLILAELNTHRMLSRNSFSSRAVPFNKMLEQLYGRPVRFGANQGGMQDKGEDFDAPVFLGYDMEAERPYKYTNEEAWEEAKDAAIAVASGFHQAGYHKQVYNRLLEPFQMMKTVLSATETANFWWLRDDLAADPTLAELARVMRQAMEEATPELLLPGEWHLPYIDVARCSGGVRLYYIIDGDDKAIPLKLEEAIKVSCARCAAVSYRNEGYGLDKSIEVYDRLVGSDKKHASAFEHCATPMQGTQGSPMAIGGLGCVNHSFNPRTWEPGITHVDRNGVLWSGNLRGFIQYRKLIPGENYEGPAKAAW